MTKNKKMIEVAREKLKMANNDEKRIAVESMHRLLKHFKDVAIGKTEDLNDEVMDIIGIWETRKVLPFDGIDLNGALERFRSIKNEKLSFYEWNKK